MEQTPLRWPVFAVLLCIGLAVILSNCTAVPETPRQRIAAVEIAFTEVVEQTSRQRLLNRVPDNVWDCFKEVVNEVSLEIDAAKQEAMVVAGPTNTARFSNTLRDISDRSQRLEIMLATGESICE